MVVSLSQFCGIFDCLRWEPTLTGHRCTNKLPFLLLKTRLGSFNVCWSVRSWHEVLPSVEAPRSIWALGHVLDASRSTTGLSLLLCLERGAKHICRGLMGRFLSPFIPLNKINVSYAVLIMFPCILKNSRTPSAGKGACSSSFLARCVWRKLVGIDNRVTVSFDWVSR